MEEIWKDIPRYEGLYQASNLGRIRTHKDKTTYVELHGTRHWKQRVLKYKSKNDKTGYRVSLWKNGTFKDLLVARLVCTTFYDDLIQTKMTVNHKDGNRFNNHIDNLEWTTLGDNIRHAFNTGLMPYKRIKITNIKTGEETIHRSMSMASKYIGRNSSYISLTLKRGKSNNKDWEWEKLD